MLSSDNEQLKKDIQDILTGCGLSRFEEQDFTFICEMIDDPKDIEKHVRNTALNVNSSLKY
jgi:hypothetical protein